MKSLTEKKWSTQANGWGQDSTAAEQIFEIETSDIGTTRHDWRGQGHSTYSFQAGDVGRKISVYTDHSNWTCWVFNSVAPDNHGQHPEIVPVSAQRNT